MEAPAEDLTALAASLQELLRARGETLATAESLTGGMLGSVLTSIAGASETYRGGLVVYATDLKSSLAGVPAALLASRGPVDPDVAEAMARGARQRLAATWGVAVTGVAGPEPQGDKPVGTVYVAVAGPAGATVALHQLGGDRNVIRSACCRQALHAVYTSLADGE